jgi:hypothetical protein
MTIISNYRVHNTKALKYHNNKFKLPTNINRVLNTLQNKKSQKTQMDFYFAKLRKSSQKVPQPSAPPAILSTRTIYIWNVEYKVEIPIEFDIYEGLRLYYPELYTAVIEEDEANRNNISIDLDDEEDTMIDEEAEKLWAQYEYLEYICD